MDIKFKYVIAVILQTKTNVVLRDSVSTESARTVEDHIAVHATKGSKIQQIQEFA